jgi:hypothetical protein
MKMLAGQEHFEKWFVVLLKLFNGCTLRIGRCLNDEKPLGLKVLQTVAQSDCGFGQVLQHVHQNDEVERGRLRNLVLESTKEYRYVKTRLSVAHDPRTEL